MKDDRIDVRRIEIRPHNEATLEAWEHELGRPPGKGPSVAIVLEPEGTLLCAFRISTGEAALVLDYVLVNYWEPKVVKKAKAASEQAARLFCAFIGAWPMFRGRDGFWYTEQPVVSTTIDQLETPGQSVSGHELPETRLATPDAVPAKKTVTKKKKSVRKKTR